MAGTDLQVLELDLSRVRMGGSRCSEVCHVLLVLFAMFSHASHATYFEDHPTDHNSSGNVGLVHPQLEWDNPTGWGLTNDANQSLSWMMQVLHDFLYEWEVNIDLLEITPEYHIKSSQSPGAQEHSNSSSETSFETAGNK